jgi:Domain of unknown function (DUF1841)
VSLFAGQDRAAMRAAWRTAWRRRLDRLPLTALELQMADVIALHPEYQQPFITSDGPASEPEEDAEPIGRAFLHLSLHLALREQLSTDRPRGITRIHRQLAALHGEGHEAEHRMMRVLEQTLWEAQRAGRLPDETRYIEELRRL